MTSRYIAWRTVLVAGLFFLYEFFQINMFNVLEASLMREFHATAQDLGWLSSMYFYGTILLLFPAGIILDRVCIRRLICFAMCITVLGAFFAIAPTLWIAGLGRLAIGIFAGPFALISVIKLATRWFPPATLSFVTGTVIAIGMCGGVLAQVPFHLLVDAIGWRYALGVDMGIGLIFLLAIYRYVHDGPISSPPVLPLRLQISQVLWRSFNWRIGLYASFTNLPIFLLGSLFSTLYLTHVHHVSAMQAASITSMLFIGMVIGSPLMGWISGRLQRRRMPMIAGAAIACAILLWIMVDTNLGPYGLAFLFGLLGISVSVHTLAYPSIAEAHHPAVVGAAEGLVGLLIMGGGAVFQPLFGKLLDWHWSGAMEAGLPVYSTSDFTYAMALMPACLLIGIALMWNAEETYGARPH